MSTQAAIRKQIMEAYTSCCMGIKRIANLEAKKQYTQLALQLRSILDANYPHHEQTLQKQVSLKKKSMDQQTQTSQPNLPTKGSKLCISQASIQEPRSSNKKAKDNDEELLEQTIEKYEGVIESLYKQIQDQESQYESELAKIKADHEKQLKEATKKNNNRLEHHDKTHTQNLELEIDRLKKELRKRDKQRIKKIRVTQNKQN